MYINSLHPYRNPLTGNACQLQNHRAGRWLRPLEPRHLSSIALPVCLTTVLNWPMVGDHQHFLRCHSVTLGSKISYICPIGTIYFTQCLKMLVKLTKSLREEACRTQQGCFIALPRKREWNIEWDLTFKRGETSPGGGVFCLFGTGCVHWLLELW